MSYIKMQCRRGMLELDFIFERFLETQYDALSEAQKKSFEALLKQEDPILYDWLVAEIPCTDAALQDIVERVRLR
jgi:antitoxin CptB